MVPGWTAGYLSGRMYVNPQAFAVRFWQVASSSRHSTGALAAGLTVEIHSVPFQRD